MSRILRRQKIGKTAAASLLAALVLLLSTLGASPSLHKVIHDDADAQGHSCVITWFANGQVSSAPTAEILIGLILLFAAVELLPVVLIPPSADYRFSSSRAPPL